jgi:DNA-binding response OmpR family regulator
MLSSKDGLFDRARGRMVGSDEYLTKPFTKDSLLQGGRLHHAPQRAIRRRKLTEPGDAPTCRSRKFSSSTTPRPNACPEECW